MNYWLINHSWGSYRRTKEYCGFISETERNQIQVGDKIAYYGNSIIFGVFEVIELVDNEFKGWERSYPYQIKIKPIVLSERGLLAKAMEGRIKILKSEGKSTNIILLLKEEFEKIEECARIGEKILNF